MMDSKRRSLRQKLAAGEFIPAPGVFDLISARIADHMRFPALYMTGYGVVASSLGLPDAGRLLLLSVPPLLLRFLARLPGMTGAIVESSCRKMSPSLTCILKLQGDDKLP